MKIVNSTSEILTQKYDELGIYEQIELAGRTSYKSLGKIQYDDNMRSTTAKDFVDMLIKNNHGAALEHGTVYLNIPVDSNIADKYVRNKYSVTKLVNTDYGYNWLAITTNYRVLVENNWLDDMMFLCEPTEYHEKRITVRFVLSRAIANEFVRHRVFSFLQESTRYCNYTLDRFNNEVSFVSSTVVPINTGIYTIEDGKIYGDGFIYNLSNSEPTEEALLVKSYLDTESKYMTLISLGVKPEVARDVLPLALKTELVMTGTISQWEEFFKLRCDKHAHPDAQKLAEETRQKMS